MYCGEGEVDWNGAVDLDRAELIRVLNELNKISAFSIGLGGLRAPQLKIHLKFSQI